MTDEKLRRALRGSAPPDPDARAEAWQSVRLAYAEQHLQPRGRHRSARALLASVIVGLLTLGAVTAPGGAVAGWAKHAIGAGTPDAAPALARIPGGGRLLVTSPAGAWVVDDQGAQRRLGDYDGAGWSPNGLFVIAWRDRRLTAVEPSGDPRWSLAADAPIRQAAWSPIDGFRIAYLAGPRLRVVNGDGTGDRAYAMADPDVRPAWRPDTRRVLAYVDRRGRIHVDAVDTRRPLWRGPRLGGVRELIWAPSGRRLLAVTRTGIILFSRAGQVVARRKARRGYDSADAAWSPNGRMIAVARHRASTNDSDVVLHAPGLASQPRTAFRGPGRLPQLAWSPGGSRLLIPWPAADQWLFLGAGKPSRIRAFSDISAQFAPGRRRPSFPSSVAWCC